MAAFSFCTALSQSLYCKIKRRFSAGLEFKLGVALWNAEHAKPRDRKLIISFRVITSVWLDGLGIAQVDRLNARHDLRAILELKLKEA